MAEGHELVRRVRRHAPRKVFEMNVRWDAIWCIWDTILRNSTVCSLLGPFRLDKFQKYGLWFETLQFFCSFQSVQLILIYFVAGRSSTKLDYIVLRLYSGTSICRTSVQQSRRYKKKDTVSFTLIIVQYVKKYLDITKRRYSEHILPVHWPFVISRFHCTQIFTRLVCLNGKHTW